MEYVVVFRFSRVERDARGYESRFKQYENEIAELRARCEAISFDIKRKIEDNDVRKNNNFFSEIFVID